MKYVMHLQRLKVIFNELNHPFRVVPAPESLMKRLRVALMSERSGDLKEDGEKQEQLENARAALSVQIAALNKKRGAAEVDNAQLAELARLRGCLRELEAGIPEMKRRKAAWVLTEAAVRRAKPAMDRTVQAETALAGTRAEIEALRKELAVYREAVQDAEKKADADVEMSAALSQIAAQIQDIARQLPRYEELADKQQEKAAAEKREADCAAELTKEQTALETLAAEIAELRDRYQTLENADSEAQDAKHRDERAWETVQALESIRSETDAITTLKGDLTARQERLEKLTEKAGQAEARYSDLYRRFIAGQAGLLAGVQGNNHLLACKRLGLGKLLIHCCHHRHKVLHPFNLVMAGRCQFNITNH